MAKALEDGGAGRGGSEGYGSGRYFLRLSTGSIVEDVPAEYCDDLDAITNDIDYLRSSDTFDRLQYEQGSYPRAFLDWFIEAVLPLYNAHQPVPPKADSHIANSAEMPGDGKDRAAINREVNGNAKAGSSNKRGWQAVSSSARAEVGGGSAARPSAPSSTARAVNGSAGAERRRLVTARLRKDGRVLLVVHKVESYKVES